MKQKYFISYVAYHNYRTDFFNDIIYIDEEITMELLERMQDSLLNKVKKHGDYFGTQIINIVKL